MALRSRLFLGDLSGGLKIHLRPVADQATNLWVSSLGGTISEPMADALDSTYAQTTAPSIFTVQLEPATTPQSVGHKLKLRASSDYGNSLKISLYDIGTLIVEFTTVLVAGIATYSVTLTTTQVNTIVAAHYHGNLYLRGEAL
jgi:hypothetical protein